MDNMEHIHGKLFSEDGGKVVFDSIDGYLGYRWRSNGMKSYYGYFEVPAVRTKGFDEGAPYRLVLDDGRAGSIYADVHPSQSPGMALAEFHVTGKLGRGASADLG